MRGMPFRWKNATFFNGDRFDAPFSIDLHKPIPYETDAINDGDVIVFHDDTGDRSEIISVYYIKDRKELLYKDVVDEYGNVIPAKHYVKNLYANITRNYVSHSYYEFERHFMEYLELPYTQTEIMTKDDAMELLIAMQNFRRSRLLLIATQFNTSVEVDENLMKQVEEVASRKARYLKKYIAISNWDEVEEKRRHLKDIIKNTVSKIDIYIEWCWLDFKYANKGIIETHKYKTNCPIIYFRFTTPSVTPGAEHVYSASPRYVAESFVYEPLFDSSFSANDDQQDDEVIIANPHDIRERPIERVDYRKRRSLEERIEEKMQNLIGELIASGKMKPPPELQHQTFDKIREYVKAAHPDEYRKAMKKLEK